DDAELAVAGELHQAMVDARADHDVVVVAGDLGGASGLERAAEAVGSGPGAIDLAEIGAKIVEHLIAGEIEQRRRTVPEAEKRRWGRKYCWVARQCVGRVAVDMALPEAAIIDVGLERERIGRLVGAVGLQESEAVVGLLRKRVDARPALVEHFDWGS